MSNGYNNYGGGFDNDKTMYGDYEQQPQQPPMPPQAPQQTPYGQQPYGQPQYQQPYGQQPYGQQPFPQPQPQFEPQRRKSSPWGWIIGGAILLSVISAVVVFFLMRDGSSSSSNLESTSTATESTTPLYDNGLFTFKVASDIPLVEEKKSDKVHRFEKESGDSVVDYMVIGFEPETTVTDTEMKSASKTIFDKFVSATPGMTYTITSTDSEIKGDRQILTQKAVMRIKSDTFKGTVVVVRSYKKPAIAIVGAFYTNDITPVTDDIVESIEFK